MPDGTRQRLGAQVQKGRRIVHLEYIDRTHLLLPNQKTQRLVPALVESVRPLADAFQFLNLKKRAECRRQFHCGN